jgi:hypothetical protein
MEERIEMSGVRCPVCNCLIDGPVCEYCGAVIEPREVTHEELVSMWKEFDEANRRLTCGCLSPNEIRKVFGLKEI